MMTTAQILDQLREDTARINRLRLDLGKAFATRREHITEAIDVHHLTNREVCQATGLNKSSVSRALWASDTRDVI